MGITAINRQTIAATGTLTLGTVSDRVQGEWHVHVSGTFVGTLQSKSYLPNQGTTTNALTIADRQPIAYKIGKTGVLTDPTVTGITAPGVYKIPCSAREVVVLECTAYTSGTIVVDPSASPLAG